MRTAIWSSKRVRGREGQGRYFSQVDAVCTDACIIASNTSTISISGLAAHVKPGRRSRFLGTHFFSPVSRMKLVEVIPLDTAPETVEAAMAACKEAGKVYRSV
jgi:3-hydroxybutyryl-CoA dehydrogenase